MATSTKQTKEKPSRELAAVEAALAGFKDEYQALQSDVEAAERELERLIKEISETQAEREAHFDEYETLISEGSPDEANESLRRVGEVRKRKKSLEQKFATFRAKQTAELRQRNSDIGERASETVFHEVLFDLRQRLTAAEAANGQNAQLGTVIGGRIDKLTQLTLE